MVSGQFRLLIIGSAFSDAFVMKEEIERVFAQRGVIHAQTVTVVGSETESFVKRFLLNWFTAESGEPGSIVAQHRLEFQDTSLPTGFDLALAFPVTDADWAAIRRANLLGLKVHVVPGRSR